MKIRFVFATIVIALVSLNSSPCYARTITTQEAVLVANQQLNKFGKALDCSIQECREIKKNGLTLAFAFDLEPRGYIVVSASTGLSPILAYSFESNFGELNQANPLFDLVTADLLRRMDFTAISDKSCLAENENLWKVLLTSDYRTYADPLFEQWPATGDGWLKTNWTQSPPYNNFCPMDPVTSLRSYAGCPATAMAQIMNFHQTANNTQFDDSDDYYHNYAGRQYWIDDDHEYADFPSFPQLNTYLDTLNAHYLENSLLTNEDKAAMTFACGVAARQVYTSQGSGTFGVNQAYDAYLRFGCNTIDLLGPNDIDLFDRLSQNIKDTLPVHLAVVDESWSTGHNVVVDGYNTDEYYHLNFGWGGSYNGWYLLPQEIPYDLTVIEGVVVDIMKKTITGINFQENLASEILIYPNPSRDMAFLNYEISRVSSVTFFLYNISGKEILKYELRDQTPGTHSVPVSLKNQPAGIYFYTLQTGNNLNSGKIIRVE